MKKIGSFLMVAILLVSLCACGASGSDNTSTGAEESTQPEQQTETVRTTPSEESSKAATSGLQDGSPVVYFTSDVNVFGGNEAWGVLMAATIGVPLYACGGTIPLLQGWLMEGMSMGSAAAFMITGPATKITNLGALKIVMGVKRFLLYIAFVIIFSFLSGLIINLIS